MAKRRHSAKDEILLVPFLDILCSLIGVLILIIVVLRLFGFLGYRFINFTRR